MAITQPHLGPRKFTFAVTVEAQSEQEAHDLIWQSLRRESRSNGGLAGLRQRGYKGPLYIYNLVRSMSKYTKPHHLAVFKRRLLERNA